MPLMLKINEDMRGGLASSPRAKRLIILAIGIAMVAIPAFYTASGAGLVPTPSPPTEADVLFTAKPIEMPDGNSRYDRYVPVNRYDDTGANRAKQLFQQFGITFNAPVGTRYHPENRYVVFIRKDQSYSSESISQDDVFIVASSKLNFPGEQPSDSILNWDALTGKSFSFEPTTRSTGHRRESYTYTLKVTEPSWIKSGVRLELGLIDHQHINPLCSISGKNETCNSAFVIFHPLVMRYNISIAIESRSNNDSNNNFPFVIKDFRIDAANESNIGSLRCEGTGDQLMGNDRPMQSCDITVGSSKFLQTLTVMPESEDNETVTEEYKHLINLSLSLSSPSRSREQNAGCPTAGRLNDLSMDQLHNFVCPVLVRSNLDPGTDDVKIEDVSWPKQFLSYGATPSSLFLGCPERATIAVTAADKSQLQPNTPDIRKVQITCDNDVLMKQTPLVVWVCFDRGDNPKSYKECIGQHPSNGLWRQE
jgi:hypothetical protein